VGGAAAVISVLAAAAKVAGFLRDRTLAVAFGVGAESDAYMVAAWVPGLIVTLVTSGVVTGLLPVFTGMTAVGRRDRAWRVASAVLSGTVLGCAVLTAFGMAFPQSIVLALAPGFPLETAALTTKLLRISLPAMLFIGLFAVESAVLQSHKRFTLSAAGPVVVNACTIAGIVLLSRRMGIAGAMLGTVAGYAAQSLLLLPSVAWRWGRFSPGAGVRDPEFREVMRLAGPVLVLSVFSHASGVIEKYLASGLTPGSVAALSFANKLVLLPAGLFSAALSTAMFPRMAEASAREDRDSLRRFVLGGSRALAYLAIPAAVGLAAMRRPIVRALFESGAFGSAATEATAAAVLWYSAGMLFWCVNPVLERAFAATKDTMTPSAAGIARVAAFGLAAAPLSRALGHEGIALAASATAGLACIFLWVVLASRLRIEIGRAEVLSFLVRVAIGCGAMVASTTWALRRVAILGLDGGVVATLACVGAGGAVYLVTTYALGVAEARDLARAAAAGIRRMRGRWGRRPAA
jgi:putative peptidoglycan lipid II flippase